MGAGPPGGGEGEGPFPGRPSFNASETNVGSGSGTGPVYARKLMEAFKRFGALWLEVLPGLGVRGSRFAWVFSA